MKKWILISFVVVLICLSFTGCTSSAEELELKNRLIIQGIGIDKSEDGQLSISVQALNTDISSNPASGEAPSDLVKYFTVTGPSVSEALNVLSEKTGKDPLLSQNRIVVFGNDFAKQGVADYLDDFIRSPENRETVAIAVADDKAEDIIFAELGDGIIPARQVEQIMQSSQTNLDIIDTKAYMFINSLKDETRSGVLPVLKVSKDDDKDVISVVSTAIFRSDRLVTDVDRVTTAGIEWVIDEVDKGKLSFMYNEKYNVTVNILRSSTKILVNIKDGRPHYVIDVKSSVDISEINDSVFNKKDLDDIKSISVECEKEIKKSIEDSIEECIMKKNTDVFGFGKRLMRAEPSYFKSNIDEWDIQMKNITYETNVSVKVKQIGDSAAVLYEHK